MSSPRSSTTKYHRVVLFGGQGSSTVFSAGTASASAEIIKRSTAAAALLSRCHLAFLEELADVDQHTPEGIGIEAGSFNHVQHLLFPPSMYHQNGLIQATTLVLHQLLHYLADIEDSNASFTATFDLLLEASGLCSGLLPAVVVSCSATPQDFVTNGVEAFRLAFWIGCRASVASQTTFRVLPGQLPASLAVAGLSVGELEEKLQVYNTMIPKTRFDLTRYYSDSGLSDSRTMPIRHGAFLDDMWAFDNAFFNISPREALSMDPQQRLLLQATQAALDDAGYVPDSSPSFQRSSTGCYVGLATGDYTENLRDSIDVYYSPGTLRAFHSGRISYVYKLSGPSIVTDTACSSSTIAIYQACRALQNGDCSTALAGGVNVMCSPDMYLGLARAHLLSPTGASKPFDEAADGYCRAEGCVMFVLKRLPDALRENDRVLGVIKDVVVNQSGTAHSITHPHGDTQIALLRQLLHRTQIDPATIGVVEAHGTGTQAGDTRELASLSTVFSPGRTARNPLLVSSIKGNIGHCEAASGAAGLAKLLIMLRKGLVPLQAGFETLNTRVASLGSDFLQPFYHGLDATLQESILHHQQTLGQAQPEFFLRDVCYTATARRCLYDVRISIACQSIEDLEQSLRSVDLLEIRTIDHPKTPIFIFSGQGASHEGMGRELIETCPLFKEWILKCDMILRRFGVPSVLAYLGNESISGPPDEQEVCLTQCACVALEYALAKLLISWGLMPSHVIGHSLGEYTALAVSGVLSLEDTLRVVALRANLMGEQCSHSVSGMLACRMSPSEASLAMAGNSELSRLAIACMNSPDDCVIAGPTEQLSKLERLCVQREIKAKRLRVPYGFHSESMDSILRQLEEIGHSVSWSAPAIPIVSTLTGALWDETSSSCDYFAQHARRPVRFSDAVEALRAHGAVDNAFFVEIGPHPITLPIIKAILGSAPCERIPTLNRNKPAWTSLSASLAQLCLLTSNIDWRAVFEGSGATLMSLPGYPLHGTSFAVLYKEPPESTKQREASVRDYVSTGYHFLPSLRTQRHLDSTFLFKTSMAIIGPPVDGHKVGGAAICPASIFIELALEAAQSCLDCSQENFVAIEDLRFQNPLIRKHSDDCRPVYVLVTTNTPNSAAEFSITVEDSNGNRDKICCSGNLARRNKDNTKQQWRKDAMIVSRQSSHLLNRSNADVSTFHTKVLYDAVFTRVVEYSKEYQSLLSLQVSTTGLEGIGTFKVPSTTVNTGCVTSHVFTDTLLHTAGFIANLVVKRSAACICAHLESVSMLYEDIEYSELFTVYCSLFEVNEGLFLADTFALDAGGRTVAIMRGLGFKVVDLSSFQTLVQAGKAAPAAKLVEDLNFGAMSFLQTSCTPATSSRSKTPIDESPILNHQNVTKNLATLLGEITGLPTGDLDLNSSLSSLGVDSLMRIELAGRLRSVFAGHDMDCDQIAEMDTIKCMVDKVSSTLDAFAQSTIPQQLSGASLWSQVSMASSQETVPQRVTASSVADNHGKSNFVPLQMSSEGLTTLHVFHDGSGQVAYYKRLEDLGRNIYGLIDSYFSCPWPRHASLVEMATDYVSKLERSSKVPFLLGGWSFGGVVAFEAGRQLVQKGIEIKGVILIDAPYPVDHQPLPQSIINHVVISGSLSRGSKNAIQETLVHEFEHHTALLAAYDKSANPTRKSAQLPPFKTVILHSEATMDVQKLCGVRYDWLSSQEHRKQAIEDWKAMEQCDVIEVLSIPGNHFEAFMPENIPAISKQLRRACQILDAAS
ncbi:MAG: hypothetical protein LQ344_007169 [Seirophora lacunosa]|nr:MAG: hypothetical protein LQ344_007169 [Seirophora lacunosa]